MLVPFLFHRPRTSYLGVTCLAWPNAVQRYESFTRMVKIQEDGMYSAPHGYQFSWLSETMADVEACRMCFWKAKEIWLYWQDIWILGQAAIGSGGMKECRL